MYFHIPNSFNLPEMKIAEYANSVDPDEVAHNEPPLLDLQCLPLVFEFSICYSLALTFFENLQTKILSSAFWSAGWMVDFLHYFRHRVNNYKGFCMMKGSLVT